MEHAIVLAPDAVDDLRNLRANVRAAVKDAIEKHLRHEPTRTSKSRIKKLRGLKGPQYRLRVGEVRVFFDVAAEDKLVEILAIVPKDQADEWLQREGEFDEEGSSE